ncbi:unnamed protein product [Prunus armeniaca]
MGKGILLACVEGNAERLNILLLTIVEDTFSEGARTWLCPEGLMAAVLLTLKTLDLFQRGVSWLGRHKGEHQVLKACGLGG